MTRREVWSCCQHKTSSFNELAEHIETTHIKFKIIVRKPTELQTTKEKPWKFNCSKCKWKYRELIDIILHFISNHVEYSKGKSPTSDKGDPTTQAETKVHQANREVENYPESRARNIESVESTICSNDHRSLRNSRTSIHCNEFEAMNAKNKTEMLRKLKLCFKCLSKHPKGECREGECHFCGGPHHVILCYKRENKERAAIRILKQEGNRERALSPTKLSQ